MEPKCKLRGSFPNLPKNVTLNPSFYLTPEYPRASKPVICSKILIPYVSEQRSVTNNTAVTEKCERRNLLCFAARESGEDELPHRRDCTRFSRIQIKSEATDTPQRRSGAAKTLQNHHLCFWWSQCLHQNVCVRWDPYCGAVRTATNFRYWKYFRVPTLRKMRKLLQG